MMATLMVTAILCGTPETILQPVFKAGEKQVFQKDLPIGSVILYAASSGTKTWTLLLTTPDRNLCIIASGIGYVPDKEAALSKEKPK